MICIGPVKIISADRLLVSLNIWSTFLYSATPSSPPSSNLTSFAEGIQQSPLEHVFGVTVYKVILRRKATEKYFLVALFVYAVQCGSNFWVCEWNLKVWSFKWSKKKYTERLILTAVKETKTQKTNT